MRYRCPYCHHTFGPEPQATCPNCGNVAAQRVDRRKRAFSLFFDPIIPLGSSYTATCTACGITT